MPDWTRFAQATLRATGEGLGDDVVYSGVVSGGGITFLSGIFDQQHDEVVFDSSGAPVSSSAPFLAVNLTDLPTYPAKGDLAVVRGETYKVTDVQPDGSGGARLILEEN